MAVYDAVYDKYLELAGKLNISPDETREWVEARVQIEIEREEKAALRDQRTIERDNTRIKAEFELAKIREIEETKRREIEATAAANASVSGFSHSRGDMIPKLKLSPLTPSDFSNIDMWLEKFERTCTALAYDRSVWGTYLMSLLQGEAMAILSSMSTEDSKSYDIIKSKLLLKFYCDKNGFKNKFFTSKPQIEETFDTFVYRLKRYFDRWLELASIASFEELIFLIIFETVLSSCEEDFVEHIKDKDPKTISHLLQVAAKYAEARPDKPYAKKTLQKVAFSGQSNRSLSDTQPSSSPSRHTFPNHKLERSPSPLRRDSRQRFVPRDVECYSCRGFGHIAKDCPRRMSESQRMSYNQTTSSQTFCGHCRKAGHDISRCFKLLGSGRRTNANVAYIENQTGGDTPHLYCAAESSFNRDGRLSLDDAIVFGKPATLLRDSGCNTVGIREDLVPQNCYTGKQVKVDTFCCKGRRFNTAIIDIECKYFTGKIEACIIKDSVADVILGNVRGINDEDKSAYVTTRLQTTELNHKDNSSTINPPPNTKSANYDEEHTCKVGAAETKDNDLRAGYPDFRKRQKEDPTLNNWFNRVDSEPVRGVSFTVCDGFLYRLFRRQDNDVQFKTLCVPESLREQVLQCAHDNNLAGHTGWRKTLSSVKKHFSWPGICRDTLRYVQSCHLCQIKSPVGKDKPAPYQPTPVIEEPFNRVIIDLVGPLPTSKNRFEYILTMVDVATRWAEATPLRHITSVSVAEALFDIFVRVGFPKEIQSDRGQQFMSHLMQEFNSLLQMKHIRSTPFHPQTNGIVERFHSTLKNMLRKLTDDNPSDWDHYLSAALFAYRNQIHSSTGFSPFFLLYGRSPRGPMDILKELWTQQNLSDDTCYQYHYVIDLHNRIKSSCKIAQDCAQQASAASIARQEPRSRLKIFQRDDKVMVLLPKSNNKLVLQLQGPYRVVKKQSAVVYLIDIDGRISPLHVNLLRKYISRDSEQTSENIAIVAAVDNTVGQLNTDHDSECTALGDQLPFASFIAEDFIEKSITKKSQAYNDMSLIFSNNIEFSNADGIAYVSAVTEDLDSTGKDILHTPSTSNERCKVSINPSLDAQKTSSVNQLLDEFADVLTSLPGHTQSIRHEIRLSSNEPIRVKPYPLAFSAQEFVREEVSNLLSLGVIEPSTSPYCSPIVLVKKTDATIRLCIDFRRLNSITIFDANNIPLPEDLFTQLAHSTIFSSCDLAKAYWQIPLHENCKHYTAFQTPLGLMQWTRMPFGLITAPATFCRLMRIVLKDLPNLLSYFDDTLVHTTTWSQHIIGLRLLLTALRKNNLTVNPSKLSIGQTSIQFLGHVVSNGTMAPVDKKVEKLLHLATPTTRKQVQSLMGLLNYYRAFIPNFSSLTKPLSDLLKKGSSTKIVWSEECNDALDIVSRKLTSDPILIIPDVNAPFVVRTDASDYGIGAVLLQDRGGILMPCRYASKKLLPREVNYSTIERECLAIVFGVTQFYKFLAFRHFDIQTDHKPLTFLKEGKAKNSRLMRWALSLQEFSFSIVPISGGANVHADALSRLV